MAEKRPTTVEDYIQAVPSEGQSHLRKLHAILRSVAPKADAVIKWGTPFFVEPRFLFAYSAHKAHINFAPHRAALEPFRKELEKHKTSKYSLLIPYNEPLPEDLIRRIAEFCLMHVSARDNQSFW